MARKPNVRYISFYTEGSAARKLEPVVPVRVANKPAPRKVKRIVIRLDPVAVMGILVAAAMIICMFVGLADLQAAREETAVMEQQVTELTLRQAELSRKYRDGYEPEVIRQQALEMGMIPAEEAPHLQIPAYAPAKTEETGGCDSFWTVLTDLFA